MFWNDKLKDIEGSLTNPESFWKKWKNANEVENPPFDPKIKGKNWYEHFYNLHTETQEETLQNPPSSAPDNVDSEIGSPFSRAKFDNVIKALKNNKS